MFLKKSIHFEKIIKKMHDSIFLFGMFHMIIPEIEELLHCKTSLQLFLEN
jgi:hypothetical protein